MTTPQSGAGIDSVEFLKFCFVLFLNEDFLFPVSASETCSPAVQIHSARNVHVVSPEFQRCVFYVPKRSEELCQGVMVSFVTLAKEIDFTLCFRKFQE